MPLFALPVEWSIRVYASLSCFSADPAESIRTVSIDSADDQLDAELKLRVQLPTTTTYGIPTKTEKISTQSLLTTSSMNSNALASSQPFSWLHRLSNRFNPAASTARTTTPKSSSTGLIFENRPTNLPPKSSEETLKHQVEYQKMCLEAKRAQQIFDEKEEQRQRLKLKREEFVSKSLQIWTQEILPTWNRHGGIHQCPDTALNAKAYKLWWHGLPPRECSQGNAVLHVVIRVSSGIRGKVWKVAIGNGLGLTHELFSQLEEMSREKLEAAKQVRTILSNVREGILFTHTIGGRCAQYTLCIAPMANDGVGVERFHQFVRRTDPTGCIPNISSAGNLPTEWPVPRSVDRRRSLRTPPPLLPF